MRKLLSANFFRLWKDKVFWIGIAFMMVISVIVMMNGCRQDTVQDTVLDNYYFNLAPVLGLFNAIFIALFLGTEYSDGTVRNKLVAGHTRTNIYLANFIVCFVAGLFFLAAWLIGGFAGVPVLGTWEIGIQGFAIFTLIAVFFTAAFVGIFVLLSTLSTNKAITAVATILLYLGLLVAASMAYNRLCEPEFFSGVVITADGMQMGDPAPNPDYISGSVRTLFEWIIDFLPTGQGILMANVEIAHPFREIICSTLIALCTTGIGVFAFRKKDLK